MKQPSEVPVVPETHERVAPPVKPHLATLYAVAGAEAAGRFASDATARALPVLRRSPLGKILPGALGKGRPERLDAALQLPRVAHVVEGLVVDRAWHEKFCRVVHASPRPIPAAPGETAVFSGVLHALAFPVAMSVLTRKDFPLPVLGMVHLSNRVQHVEPVPVGEELTATAWTENLRPHRAGTVLDAVVTLARADGTVMWAGRSGYLAKGHFEALAGQQPRTEHDDAGPGRPRFEAPRQTAQWALPAGTGREYAAVSGDYNPIHLSDPSAKALGMKGAIAHGMYTASRALAATAVPAGTGFEWSVEFAAPVVLPTTVAVSVSDDGRGEHWRGSRVTAWNSKRTKPHLELEVTAL